MLSGWGSEEAPPHLLLFRAGVASSSVWMMPGGKKEEQQQKNKRTTRRDRERESSTTSVGASRAASRERTTTTPKLTGHSCWCGARHGAVSPSKPCSAVVAVCQTKPRELAHTCCFECKEAACVLHWFLELFFVKNETLFWRSKLLFCNFIE